MYYLVIDDNVCLIVEHPHDYDKKSLLLSGNIVFTVYNKIPNFFNKQYTFFKYEIKHESNDLEQLKQIVYLELL